MRSALAASEASSCSVISASALNIVSETAPLLSSLPSTTMIFSFSVTVSAILCQIGLNFRAAPEREPLMSTAVSSALVVKLDFSPALASDAAAAQPRARQLVEIVRFNAQDAREFSDPLVRDAIASVFIAADLPRSYVSGLGKLTHCHPAMLTVFLQALSDVCVDGALAIHGARCSLASVLYPEGQVCQAHLIRSRPLFALSLGV